MDIHIFNQQMGMLALDELIHNILYDLLEK